MRGCVGMFVGSAGACVMRGGWGWGVRDALACVLHQFGAHGLVCVCRGADAAGGADSGGEPALRASPALDGTVSRAVRRAGLNEQQ